MIQSKWKKPKELKKIKKAKREMREAEALPIENQEAVIYVHSPEKGVTLPAHPDEIFAVVRINGNQVKVLNNDLIRVETLPFELGQQICITDVLLVGSLDYTAIGRPCV